MPYYYPIHNERLRLLVIASESIHSLDEHYVQRMVFQIANLPLEAQQVMVATLEDEQRQIMAVKRARGITSAAELKQVKEKTAQIRIVKRNYEVVVRVRNEKVEVAKAQSVVNDLLREI